MSKIRLFYKFKTDVLQYLNEECSVPGKYWSNVFTNLYFESLSTSPDGELPGKFSLARDIAFANSEYKLKLNHVAVEKKINAFHTDLIKSAKTATDVGYSEEKGILTDWQVSRLKSLYVGKEGGFNNIKNKFTQLLKFVGGISVQLSIPPKIFDGMSLVEMFGSSINTSHAYLSPYPIDDNFGRLGSYFEFKMVPGNYSMNPPFGEEIMKSAIVKVLADLTRLAKAGKLATVYITMPVWDSKSQKSTPGLIDYKKPFEAFDLLMKSKLPKTHKILNKYRYKYWNYYSGRYVAASYTHLVVISSKKITITANHIAAKWAQICHVKQVPMYLK
jgi:hypothetical protein